MNDVNAHTEGFSDGVNGRCTASGCVGPQRSPTLHIYDPPWDALGYNASVARAVAAVYGEVMVAPVDTRFSYVGASTAIFNELPRLFPAAPAMSADLFLLPLHPWALCFANDVVVGQRSPTGEGVLQFSDPIGGIQSRLVRAIFGHQPQLSRGVRIRSRRGFYRAVRSPDFGTNGTIVGNPFAIWPTNQ